jgi:acetyltransferase-like isoleucine patch superfamily enzyme
VTAAGPQVVLPRNVEVGSGTTVTGDLAFKRFRSHREPAIILGRNCVMDGTQFAIGEQGRLEVGDHCYFTNAVLLVETEVTIGSYVIIGWNATIADSNFHPIDPAQRVADALACSPLANGRPRPPVARRPVVIDDDVWIGPSAVILKGVHIGAGAFVEPGSVVTADVTAGTRVLGNPARAISETGR